MLSLARDHCTVITDYRGVRDPPRYGPAQPLSAPSRCLITTNIGDHNIQNTHKVCDADDSLQYFDSGNSILAHGEVIRDVCQVWPGLKLWLENKVEITLLPRAGLTGSGGLAWVAGHDGHTPPHVQSHHLMRASIATSFNYHQRHWSWCDHVSHVTWSH